MKDSSLQLAQVADIRHQSEEYSRLADDYIFSRTNGMSLERTEEDAPVKFNGVTLFLCRQGHTFIDINLERFDVGPGTLVIIGPSSLVYPEKNTNATGDILFLSAQLLREVHFDPGVLRAAKLSASLPPPVISLTKEEFNLVNRYMELLHFNAVENTDMIYARNIGRSMAAAVLYQIIQLIHKHYYRQEEELDEAEAPISSRRMSYLHRFARLLQENYRKERSVGFYASKLCISPKYLSHIVKETTGRTAASWIDQYVILEAKNLLRFSDMNVQQVTYHLNFPNQSSFGKYFKHLTGMSPSEYQKS